MPLSEHAAYTNPVAIMSVLSIAARRHAAVSRRSRHRRGGEGVRRYPHRQGDVRADHHESAARLRRSKSQGEFEQSRPNRFAFRFTDPKGDVIICDGRYVWAYLPTSAPGRVNRAACGGDQAGSLDLIGEFFTNPKARYTIGDGGAATVGDRKRTSCC